MDKITPLNILIAEDNKMNQFMIKELLEMDGHNITIAEDGRKVIDLWQNGDYDLILMDLQMPEMSGFEATVQIRRMEKSSGDHIPIIALSAYSEKDKLRECKAAGMDDFINKAFETDELMEKIENLLSDREDKEIEGKSREDNGYSTGKIEDLFNLNKIPHLRHNTEKMKQYVQLFFEGMNFEISKIEKAIEENTPEEIGIAVHSIKSMCWYLHKEEITRITSEIECITSEDSIKGVLEKFSQLKEHFEDLKRDKWL